jgi:hypothetical protein
MELVVIKPSKPLMNVPELERELKKVIVNLVADGTRFIARYPPRTLTKTGYTRTDTLKRSWLQSRPVVVTNDTIEGEIGSNANLAPYNRFVEGAEDQLPMFRNAGWQNTDDLKKLIEKRLPEDVEAVFKKLTR